MISAIVQFSIGLFTPMPVVWAMGRFTKSTILAENEEPAEPVRGFKKLLRTAILAILASGMTAVFFLLLLIPGAIAGAVVHFAIPAELAEVEPAPKKAPATDAGEKPAPAAPGPPQLPPAFGAAMNMVNLAYLISSIVAYIAVGQRRTTIHEDFLAYQSAIKFRLTIWSLFTRPSRSPYRCCRCPACCSPSRPSCRRNRC